MPGWLWLRPPAAAAVVGALPFCACSGTAARAACTGSPFPCHRKGALTCRGRPVSFLAKEICRDRCNAVSSCARCRYRRFCSPGLAPLL